MLTGWPLLLVGAGLAVFLAVYGYLVVHVMRQQREVRQAQDRIAAAQAALLARFNERSR